MRGKDQNLSDALENIGITPAYAGKRFLVKFIAGIIWDHPRLCGEKVVFAAIDNKSVGSPPPMRGKEADGSVNFDTKRITPAYAGKRLEDLKEGDTVQDHPRLCGEKCLLWRTTSGKRGSPPPMRGKGKVRYL